MLITLGGTYVCLPPLTRPKKRVTVDLERFAALEPDKRARIVAAILQEVNKNVRTDTH